MWAQKGDPMQAGHIQMMLNAIVNHRISKMIVLVDNSAPGIKDGLSSIHLREPLVQTLFRTMGVEPLITYLPIMKNEDYLLDKIGEVSFFIFWKSLSAILGTGRFWTALRN